MVSLVREPQNPYDKNAVQVNNVNGHQVGHIKRELAAPIAHIMDNNLAKVEGIVPFGVTNAFTMPVQLYFWGKEENKAEVINKLKGHGYKLGPALEGLTSKAEKQPWSNPWQSGGSLAAVPMTQEQLKSAFDKLFEDLMEEKTQEMEPTKVIFRTPLLPHQKQALAWMVLRENNNNLPPFWEQNNNLYFNVLTNFAVKERPETVLGGILADDMGLGKTLTTIALILTNFHNGKPLPVGKTEVEKPAMVKTNHNKIYLRNTITNINCKSKTDQVKVKTTACKGGCSTLKEDMNFAAVLGAATASSSKQKVQKKGDAKPSLKKSNIKDAKATLIICPLSVLSNWQEQFEQHVGVDVKLNVYVYYGTDRSRDSSFLAKQDVVLTTYNVLTVDYRNNSPLHKVEWLRVVLDEGHVIRNPSAMQTKAVLDLKAQRRWILTGTPIQNSLKDLWTLIAFLKLKPFDVKEWWNRTIQRPVAMGYKDGLKNLQALVKGITLRRTKRSKIKGKPVVELPGRTVFIQHVTLSEEERLVYDTVKSEGKTVIGQYFREGTVLSNYAHILAILVRLRQLCCHPLLMGNSLSAAGPKDPTTTELREKLINQIQMVLNSGSDEECAICLDSLRLPVITYCAHVYCKLCICQVIRIEQKAKCPLCRADIKIKELVEYLGEKNESGSEDSSSKWMSSSKVDALMSNLLKLRKKDPSIKSLVVSQFTKLLSLMEIPLREAGILFTRLDGSMNQTSRVAAIQAFQSTDPGAPTIMLLSLKAGGVGLNLTAASQVFLMDPAWNPAAEDQCFDRCHRLGQKRDVIITKFIVKDSVEENMTKIQKKKQDLVAKAFGGQHTHERNQARIEEIKALMEI
ncbi:HLTF factor, partial [Amia calva]|nr:HLTF factor [Amia calva]